MATYDANRTRRTLWMPELAVPLLFLIVVGVVVGAAGGEFELDLPVIVFYAVLVLLALWTARCRVTLTKDEIVQHSFFRRQRVPARQVESVRVRHLGLSSAPPYPILVLKDGTKVGLWFAGGFINGGWRNGNKIRSFYYHLAQPSRPEPRANRAGGRARRR